MSDQDFTRVVIEAHAEELLERMFTWFPDLKIMQAQSTPTEPGHLAWMLDIVKMHASDWPLDKLGRWIGYVQGVLIEQRKLSADEERNRTRAAYQTAYAADGLRVPETL